MAFCADAPTAFSNLAPLRLIESLISSSLTSIQSKYSSNSSVSSSSPPLLSLSERLLPGSLLKLLSGETGVHGAP